MKKTQLIILVIAFLFSCSSPQDDQKTEEAFIYMFPNVPMNKDIKFWEPTEKAFNSKDLTLDLENLSVYQVRFEEGKDLYILTFSAGNWVRLNNDAVYSPPGRLLSPKSQDLPGVTGVSMIPVYSNMGFKPLDIRVVLVATLYDNEISTDQKTGAHIDLTLYP